MPITPTNSLTYQTLATIQLAGAEISAYDAVRNGCLPRPTSACRSSTCPIRRTPSCHDHRVSGASDVTSVATYQRPDRGRRPGRRPNRPGQRLSARFRWRDPAPVHCRLAVRHGDPQPRRSSVLVANEGEATPLRLVRPARPTSIRSGRSASSTCPPAGSPPRPCRPRASKPFTRLPAGRGRSPVRQFAGLRRHHRRAGSGARIYRRRARRPTAWVTLQEANSVAVRRPDRRRAIGHRHHPARPSRLEPGGPSFDPSDQNGSISRPACRSSACTCPTRSPAMRSADRPITSRQRRRRPQRFPRAGNNPETARLTTRDLDNATFGANE